MAEKNNSELKKSNEVLAKLSINKISNKVAIIEQTALVSIIAIAYLIEFIKGNRTLPYVLATIALCFVPVVIAVLVYKRNPD